jgi:hypothetical protein
MTLGILGLILAAFAIGSAATAYYVHRWAYQLGYRDGAHDLDDLRAELYDAEQQMAALRYFRRAA